MVLGWLLHMQQGSLQGQVVTRGHLPTGAGNKLSVEPTLHDQGLDEITPT